jgi:hypothetical protein
VLSCFSLLKYTSLVCVLLLFLFCLCCVPLSFIHQKYISPSVVRKKLYTKYCLSRFSGPLVIAMKWDTEYRFHVMAMPFYSGKNCLIEKLHIFSKERHYRDHKHSPYSLAFIKFVVAICCGSAETRCKILVGNPQGGRHFERRKHRTDDNINLAHVCTSRVC